MKQRIFVAFLVSAIIASSQFFVRPAGAQADPAFNMNNIIGDDQLLDVSSMSLDRIQEFLNGHTGVLKTYTIPQADGTTKTAAQVIYESAISAQISPKFLLVTLQKEESLIDDPAPSQTQLDWATGYGFCDSCTTSTPSIQQYKGFANQVGNTAQLIRRYLNNLQTIGITTAAIANTWGPGKSNTILCISSDASGGRNLCTPGTNITITPANFATSILYTYTPHPGGNYSFWKIWKNFSFNTHRVYPDGSLLQAKGSKVVYMIQNGVKRPFASQSTFLTLYSAKQVITVTADALAQYDTGTTIFFANYTLMSAPNRGVYLLYNDTKRAVRSGAALKAAGLAGKKAVKVTWDILSQLPDGNDITTADVYPAGALLQNNKTGAVFYVKDGVKYPISSGDIYKDQFGGQKATKVAAAQLDQYQWGPFVGFRDGDLVQSKTGGPVYFISNGYRLPIASMAAAKAYGFDKIMINLIKTTDKAIAVHPEGQSLDIDSGMVTVASK